MALSILITLKNGKKQYKNAVRHNANSKQIMKSLDNGNRKLVIRNDDNTEDHLGIHFYGNTSKLMVQSGQFKEKNLLNFISLIPTLRLLPVDSCVWEREEPVVTKV